MCPESLPKEIGNRLYERLLKDANELGATLLWAREFQQDAPAREFSAARGFFEAQRFTQPDQLPMVAYILEVDRA